MARQLELIVKSLQWDSAPLSKQFTSFCLSLFAYQFLNFQTSCLSQLESKL